MRTRLFALACAALAACDDPKPAEVPPDAGAPVSCLEPGPAPRFSDRTEPWGLGPVRGNRITAGDLDGDGFPDLIVHAVSANKRETVGQPPKLVWVLMNRPKEGGGRRFVDATEESGFFQVRGGSQGQLRSAQLAVLGDVDGDGDLDAFSGTYVDANHPETDPGDRSEILLNDGAGRFSLAAPSAPTPAAEQLWSTTSAAFTDADRDGRLDLFVGFFYERYGRTLNGLQARLYRGLGGATFEDATEAAGLTTDGYGFDDGTNHRPAYGVTACDLDGDGAAELMVSAYGRQWNLLYRNGGKGTFQEQREKVPAFAGDANVDFRDNEFFKCFCTVKAGSHETCEGVEEPQVQCPEPPTAYWSAADERPWRNNGNTFTTACADFDGDGRNDLFNAEIHHWWAGQGSDSSELILNRSEPGKLKLSRPGNAATGLSWPHPTLDWNEGGLMAAPADLDNDGLEDLVVAASDYPDQFGLVFHQKPDHTFEEVGAAWGVRHPCMSGLAVADFDRDGDLDILAGAGTARDCAQVWKNGNELRLYENDAAQAGAWLLVKLAGDGKTANRAGIGARVAVKAGDREIVKELGGGYGHFGMQNDTVLFFGLSACGQAEQISVRWPDAAGTTEVWRGVGARRFVELRQGDPEVRAAAP